MPPIRIFISSAQKEFTRERAALRDYMRGDALMRRFFEAFLFEDVPASGQRPDALYLNEVAHCDLYVGLFGSDYGAADADGLSATEREFNYAGQLGKLRLIFLKGAAHATRDARMAALIARAEGELVRKRFRTAPELISGLYAALVEYLEANLLLRSGAFDADYCRAAGLDDLDPERLQWLVRRARHERGFPLREGVRPQTLLQHLNLGKAERLTNAALLLFGRAPQKYLVSSELKCAHFHGTQVAKPIASLQVYKGTVFDLVNQAVDFVLSKVDRRVGTRAQSAQVPVTYEIPKEVVTEAVVNAVAHRDYTSNGSVQVMLFADRLEIWNPGALPPALTLAQLSVPHSSIPANPLLAESLYLAGYIERMGTGTLDMRTRCLDADLAPPEFALTDGFVVRIWRRARRLPTEQPEAKPKALATRLLDLLATEPLAKAAISRRLGQKRVSGQLNKVMRQLMAAGQIEYTRPDTPRSRLQRYRLTAQGQAAARAGTEPPESKSELKPESKPESKSEMKSELKPESLAPRLLDLLATEPLAKAAISRRLGQKRVSGQLNKVMRQLMAAGQIEYTRPDTPRSRLQRYRLTAQGQATARAGTEPPESKSELKPESKPESKSELKSESLATRLLDLLATGPLAKAAISRRLGQKRVSGQLNKVMRQLMAAGQIEYTRPDTPRSPLQRYRLTAQGQAAARAGTEPPAR